MVNILIMFDVLFYNNAKTFLPEHFNAIISSFSFDSKQNIEDNSSLLSGNKRKPF